MALFVRSCIVAVLALLLAACAEGEDADSSGDAVEEHGTPIAAVEIQPRHLSRQLSMSATVEPRVRIRLASRANGTLDEVRPEVGDAVNARDVLARLDVSEEQAELDRARAQEDHARRQYERTRELRDQGVASAAALQRDDALLQVAESERRLAEPGRVRGGGSAADAVVTARYVEPGEAVDARQTLFELAAMDELVMRPGVSELDVAHLEEGMDVPLRLEAMPGEPLQGRIRRIFPMAASDSRLVTVEIVLPDDAAERGVRPGYLGRVRMAIDRRPDSLAVPSGALGEDEDGRYVYVVEDEHLRRRGVEPGVTRGEWTEILDGLEQGEVVLATNPLDMINGQSVRIVGWRG